MSGSKFIFNLLIAIVVVLLLFFGYRALRKDETTPEPAGAAPGLDAAGFSSGAAGKDPADEFLTVLTDLQELNLRADVFANPVFKDLQESNVVFSEQAPGRSNPFSPVNFGTLNLGGVAPTPAATSGATSSLERLRAN